jgi:glycosyltransferase involved in cell wall biosynthesis
MRIPKAFAPDCACVIVQEIEFSVNFAFFVWVNGAMHVALWSPAWPLEKNPNGIIAYVTAMRLELEKRGHRVSVFTGKLDESVKDERVFPVEQPKWRQWARRLSRSSGHAAVFDLPAALSRAILREHRRNPIDILEMEESFGWFAEVQARTSLPMVVKLHGPAFLTAMGDERDTPFVRERIEREGQALARSRTIVSPSEANLKRTMERYELADKLTRIVVNPIVIDERTPTWSLDGCDPRTILFVGRFDLVKGADVLLQAFSSVLKRYPDAKLVFAGPDNGWLSADGTRVDFSAYIRSVLSPETVRRVDFLGRVEHGDVAGLRTSAMVAVVASRWESQPYTLLEAMAQGCPIVSTDAGACPESIFPGRTGLLARSEDAEDFAAKICAVLGDPQAAAAMGRTAREHVMRHHSPTAVADAMLDIYASVIADQVARS